FGKDAIALPLDETASAAPAALTQSPASQGIDPRLPLLNQPLAGTDADTGETLSPLQAFLVHAALEAGDNQAQAGQDAVQLMTVHASKGLEFDAVFIVGLEEGLFPHENALSDKGGLEEERRLMYVAITRARQRLYLSHAQSRMLHGRTSFNLPSRFLDELPSACVKHLSARGFGSFSPKKEAASAYSTRFSNTFNSENIIKSADTALNSKNTGSITKGQTVFHAKFGEGRVLAIEGVGDDARAQVNFPRHGSKWLALAIAKLTVVE
ncbi:MAG TPA: 3'-5' exonuclease, partial [Comamonas denitrificans]|nr:3'-5' exonuclease [Comamonas denitrificans]